MSDRKFCDYCNKEIKHLDSETAWVKIQLLDYSEFREWDNFGDKEVCWECFEKGVIVKY